jgi:hypothetical protein
VSRAATPAGLRTPRMPSLYLDRPTFPRHVEQMFGEIED